MKHFDAERWARQFERLGGIVALKYGAAGSQLWTGVVRLRPEDGLEAERMNTDLTNHPEWREPLTRYARERMSTTQRELEYRA